MKLLATPYRPLTVLIGLNVVLFVIIGLLSLFSVTGLAPHLILCAPFGTWIHEPWGLLTYMFVQIDFLHLLFNMIWLLSFGVLICRFGNSRRLVSAYIVSGFAGAVSFLIVSQIQNLPTAFLYGSSSAVLGVIGACAALYPLMKLNMVLFGNVELRWIALVALILCGIAPGLGNLPTLVAHLAGAAGGYAYGKLTLRTSLRTFNRHGRVERTKRSGSINVRQQQKRGLSEADQADMDALLLRVSKNGYKSLSMNERRQLFELSNKINPKK